MKIYADAPEDVRKICSGWYDGFTSAMYSVATNKPFNPAKLVKEVNKNLDNLKLIGEKAGLLLVKAWADEQNKRAKAKINLEKAAIMAYNSGMSFDEVYTIISQVSVNGP